MRGPLGSELVDNRRLVEAAVMVPVQGLMAGAWCLSQLCATGAAVACNFECRLWKLEC